MLRAYSTLIALGLIWGTNFIYMKWATALISPMQTVFLRVFLGFLPLALMAWRAKVVDEECPTRFQHAQSNDCSEHGMKIRGYRGDAAKVGQDEQRQYREPRLPCR
ncbi:hypothetical protein CR51_14745 [Caballeronia megalochromosomata]|nr:hypothetical protein CR51_14745 [Caballeronia megalochromosomata]